MPYITADDIPRYGIKAAMLEDVEPDDLETAALAASSEAACYVGAVWPEDETAPHALKLHASKAAVYHLMGISVGFNPVGRDELIAQNYDRALEFYKMVQAGSVTLPEPEPDPDEEESTTDTGVEVVANRERGW